MMGNGLNKSISNPNDSYLLINIKTREVIESFRNVSTARRYKYEYDYYDCEVVVNPKYK
jgi:hypothetical protein